MPRTRIAEVTMYETGVGKTLWAQRQGTRAEIRETAVSLLLSLREDDPRAQVYIDGKRVIPQKGEKAHGQTAR